MCVSLTTVKDCAPLNVPPKSTAVAPVNPVPVIVTVSPPKSSPEAGDTPVTVGGLIVGGGPVV